MGRPRSVDGLRKTFYISHLALERLTSIAQLFGISLSQAMTKILEEQEPINFDVREKKDSVDKEQALLRQQIKDLLDKERELENKKEELNKIGKQGKVLDRMMKSHVDRVLQDLRDAFSRGADKAAIGRIASQGSIRTGIKAEELVIMAMERLKK